MPTLVDDLHDEHAPNIILVAAMAIDIDADPRRRSSR
jgi:hypothetical protein